MPEKSTQKLISKIPQKYLGPLFLIALAVVGGGYFVSNALLGGGAAENFSGALGSEEFPASSAPAAIRQPTYINPEFGFSVRYPSDWTRDTLVDNSSGNIMFRPAGTQAPCFSAGTVCPIGIIVAENPKNKPLESFSGGFYPDKGWAQGGTEIVPVGDAQGERFFNFGNTGGQIVFVRRDGYILKFFVQGEPMVTLDSLNVFEQMVRSFEFTDMPAPTTNKK